EVARLDLPAQHPVRLAVELARQVGELAHHDRDGQRRVAVEVPDARADRNLLDDLLAVVGGLAPLGRQEPAVRAGGGWSWPRPDPEEALERRRGQDRVVDLER